jgi:Ca2+-binding RTX toxin-like protein
VSSTKIRSLSSNPFLFLSVGILLLPLFFIFKIGLTTIVYATNDDDDDDCDETNIIIGTRTYTKGTSCDDVIIGCPMTTTTGTGCSTGDTLRGLEGNDVLQGSIGDDSLYGDEGDDELTGADGNDKLYGGPDNDVLLAGIGNDLLVGDKGNDELYAGPGDDVLIGGPGADYFDCGEGYDIIIDFDPARGDTHADNCEVVLNDLGSKEIYSQGGVVKSRLQAFGIGSEKHPIELEEVGETIDD